LHTRENQPRSKKERTKIIRVIEKGKKEAKKKKNAVAEPETHPPAGGEQNEETTEASDPKEQGVRVLVRW
jgi:hypothetical protein